MSRRFVPLKPEALYASDRVMPISADGETEVHHALGFDHRGRVDVAINPRAPEGIWLRRYLLLDQDPDYALPTSDRVPGKAR